MLDCLLKYLHTSRNCSSYVQLLVILPRRPNLEGPVEKGRSLNLPAQLPSHRAAFQLNHWCSMVTSRGKAPRSQCEC